MIVSSLLNGIHMILVGGFVHYVSLLDLKSSTIAMPENFFYQYFFHIEFLKEQISVRPSLSHNSLIEC